MTDPAAKPSPATKPAAAAPKNVEVHIAGMKFNPDKLDIACADSVTWVNDDDVEHTVSSDRNSELRVATIIIPPKKSSDPTHFRMPGTFSYHCDNHTEMTGTVTIK